MKAARRYRYGTDDMIVVEDLPTPAPRDDELLIRVHASTVSRTDCALLAATPFVMRFMTGLTRPKRATLGTDFAGEVQAVGKMTSGFSVGDRVWGINDVGASSHAEFMTIGADDSVARMPQGLSYEKAAASLEGPWYAYSMIVRSGMGEGAKVMLNGATGGIGSALLQLCVQRQAVVTAVGNTKNLQLLTSLGAARVIDYEHHDFTQDEETYDFVFDAVGKSTFGACRRLLKSRGVYVSCELGPGGQNLFLAAGTPLFGKRKVVFPFPIERKRFLSVMAGVYAEYDYRPVIERSYEIDQIAEAYAYSASGQKTGSIVLKF